MARNVIALILLPLILTFNTLSAQTHIVSPAELQKEAVAATKARQHDADTVNRFLSSPKAQKVLATAGIDAQQVKTAVAALDDAELARLAEQSRNAQADFAAGRISDRDLLFILVGIAVVILIIVAVD